MRFEKGGQETLTSAPRAPAEGTLSRTAIAATGSGQPWRTVNTAGMRSPRSTRAPTPLRVTRRVASVQTTATAPSSSIASRA